MRPKKNLSLSDTNVMNVSVNEEVDQNTRNTIDSKKAVNTIEKMVDNLSKNTFIQSQRRRRKEKKKLLRSTIARNKSKAFVRAKVILASDYTKIFNKNKI